APAVAPAALARRRPEQALVAGVLVAVVRGPRVGREERRLREVGRRRDRDALAVAPGALALRGPVRLAERWQPADADHAATLLLEPDEHAVERHAANERLRPVDRVDDPAPAARPRLLAVLLAQEPVVGERVAERGPERFLGAAIGDRDRRLVGLALDVDAFPEVLERDSAGAHDRLARDLQLSGVGPHAADFAHAPPGPSSRSR